MGIISSCGKIEEKKEAGVDEVERGGKAGVSKPEYLWKVNY